MLIDQMVNKELRSGSMEEKCIDSLGKLAARWNIYRMADSRVEVLRLDSADLILTPLSGSSAIRLNFKSQLAYSIRSDVTKYMLWRDDEDRVQSFFNKRLKNATTIGKALYLASTPELSRSLTADEFIDAWIKLLGAKKKDKHLLANYEVLSSLGVSLGCVKQLRVNGDQAFLESLTNVSLNQRVNSTIKVSKRHPPVVFDSSQRSRIFQAVKHAR